MIRIRVFSQDYICSCILERSVTVLTGLSGSGKTVFVNMAVDSELNTTSEVTEVGVSLEGVSGMELQHLTNEFLNAVFTQINSDLKNNREYICPYDNILFILDDDCTRVKNSLFTTFLKKAVLQGCYFLIVTHDLTDAFSSIRCSIHSVLSLSRDSTDSRNRLVTKYYDLSDVQINTRPDLVVIEDSGDGFTWFKNLYSDSKCVTTKGANGILPMFRDNSTEWRDKKILLIFDTAAYGLKLMDLQERLRTLGYRHVYFANNYECFEELLLQSNLLRQISGNICFDNSLVLSERANKYITWERFFEEYLEELTRGTCLKYKHITVKMLNKMTEIERERFKYENRFHRCYYDNCENVSGQEDYCNGRNCSYYIGEEKYEFMLRNTKFSFLLNLR